MASLTLQNHYVFASFFITHFYKKSCLFEERKRLFTYL